jgi:hypothetical protein
VRSFLNPIDPAETAMSHAKRSLPWRWAVALGHSLWPFWLFKDATEGDLFARAAASDHNRRMSEVLPRYLRRWLLVLGVACLSICANDAMATDVARRLDVFVLMAAGSGLVCAYAICAMLVIGYAWCYLRLAKR